MEIESSRRYRFRASPDAVWQAMADTGDYRRRWPWLTSFDGDGLVAGRTWRCTVRPPLRYRVRFEIHLDEVEPGRLVTARVSGDIEGAARIELTPDGDGCEVRFTSALAPSNRGFALLAGIARPLVTRGHDWVLDTGARQFGAAVERR